MIIRLAILLGVISIFPYGIYLFGIIFGKMQEASNPLEMYPPISVVFSAYNEGANIERRLRNLKDCNYPDLQIIAVDDKSSDNTVTELRKWLVAYEFSFRLIENKERMGTSASYNRAIENTTRDVVVVTDADVRFRRDALFKIIDRLMSSDEIGAVTGDLQPEENTDRTTGFELRYRSVYGRMCEWESSHDSTFAFNGALMAFKKSAVSRINHKAGADDANIAFAAIRNGHITAYESEAVVYESIPTSFHIQYSQKARRATGLIRSVLSNLDLMGRIRPFSLFYFFRTWMIIVSPSLFLVSVVLLLIGSLAISPLVAVTILGAMVMLMLMSELFSAFCLNQIYLVAGLLNIGKNVQTWESTSSLGGK